MTVEEKILHNKTIVVVPTNSICPYYNICPFSLFSDPLFKCWGCRENRPWVFVCYIKELFNNHNDKEIEDKKIGVNYYSYGYIS